MNIKFTLISILIIVSAIIGFGCGDDHDGMMSTNTDINDVILTVSPADGATGVSTSASISVKFNKLMDTMSVINNFHLMSGEEMREWMDTLAHHGGMGHMSMGDMDHMMSWMDSIAIPGTFNWNDAMDSCEFTPATGMITNHDHMIIMDEGGMMDHNGGMMNSNHSENQYHSYHFMTGSN